MDHLQPSPGNPNRFRYRDGTEGDVIEVEIWYSKGTTPASRGLHVGVHALTITGEFEFRGFSAGIQRMVRSLDRASRQTLERTAAAADARVPELAAAYRADPDGLGRTALELLAADLTGATGL
ncbi:hypothetical protein [Longimicrobium terrae]|uniref:Uncharacterized protein n=1 Tax=Longimicrobium terrae TaxID=1639882 RepID=A0A841GXG5_9BACT|nr:hypothetical protein [Longimicrobium terrae]MBB4635940.1 hypothetical protein [Longimicrobium terrae]MBB6070336.1 hypothetical protein [Longimicrobium terrae]NNC30836.1 hypothetical protein [Longimicrobium terrae]